MDSPSFSNQFNIFQIYRRYCEITLEVYASEGDGYGNVNESMKDKLVRKALSQLLELLKSRVYKRAIMAWKLVLSGRFKLLNQWCSFIKRHNISGDTWRQVLAFSRCVHENLKGYDPEGAWPVMIDGFVEHMYRMSGSDDTHKLSCKCGDMKAQSIHEALPGLKVYHRAKRKLEGLELEFRDSFVDMNIIFISKIWHTMEHVKHNISFGCCNSPCAVEASLSKGFAQLFSSHSCLQKSLLFAV